jgi:Histidine kinase
METLLKFLPSAGLPIVVRYGTAAILVAVFFLLSFAAGTVFGPYGYIILIVPVVLASVLFDRGSGFFATGLSVLAMSSVREWQDHVVRYLAAPVLFAVVAALIAGFCEALRKALERGAAAQQELQLLLTEQRHRTKNDLALLSSMIQLQARSQSSPAVRAALESAVGRLHAIAEGQDKLQSAGSEQTFNMQEFWRMFAGD